ncbi:diguanylate cyclase domain-containing protein [Dactylosporangium sp. CA-152071]|uniref:diguanylate cyclase domain-containing protein n=1 Tax=Dactylosporangium sp. CA-152071 TaxID=3239933 RepID=UPI003D90D59C
MRSRETVVVAVLTAALLVVVLQHPGASYTGWATCVMTFGVGLRWLQSAVPARGRMRIGLRLLAAGFMVWSGGQLAWLADAPQLATATFNTAMLLMAAGAAWMAATRRLGSVRAVLDGLIMATSLCFISWAVALGPLYRASDGGTAAFSAATYPLGDVLIGSITLLMLYETRGPRRRSVAIAAAGLLTVFAADTAYASQVFAGTYRPGGLTDLGWFLGFAIVGIGAPRADEIDGTVSMVTEERTWDHLPYLPFGAALCVGVGELALRGGRVDGVLFLLMILMTVLILVRQVLALRDNRLLNRRLAELVDDLRHRAYHDPLTGLPNRALLLDTLERRLETGRPVALLYVDLDGFKPVNDTHGHEAGDRVLATIAARLAGCAGDEVVARLGGDEFALLVPPAAAEDLAAAVIAAVGVPVPIPGPMPGHGTTVITGAGGGSPDPAATVTVGASVGIAVGGTGAGDLMRHADVAMYAAKLRGRNRAVTFTPRLEPMAPLTTASAA